MAKLPTVAYLFDEETGVYLNETALAVENAPGQFTIPANSTLEPPPSPPDPKRMVAVFRNGEWTIERKGSAPDQGTAASTQTQVVTGPTEPTT